MGNFGESLRKQGFTLDCCQKAGESLSLCISKLFISKTNWKNKIVTDLKIAVTHLVRKEDVWYFVGYIVPLFEVNAL